MHTSILNGEINDIKGWATLHLDEIDVAEGEVYLQTGEFVSLNGAMFLRLLMDRETDCPS